MSDAKNQAHSRRKFLSFGVLAGVGAVANKIAAQTPPDSGEEMMMLTKDGKLVAIDKSVLDNSTQKKQATKRDIMSWVHNPK